MTAPAPRTGILPPAVKICGLTRREDAEAALRAGADYLGVILVPGSPRGLTADRAETVTRGLGAGVVAVLADADPNAAVRDATTLGAAVVQLHGEETPAYAAEMGRAGPWEVWKALRVRNVEDVLRTFDAYGDVVQGILLDGWHPRHRGGAGVLFAWEEVSRLRAAFPPGIRFIAAGGLHPGNVAEAVHRLSPHVVDVSSGVETRPGIKDWTKMTAFVGKARRALKGGGT
jgi:phosphoribosylanthranilate isomerase